MAPTPPRIRKLQAAVIGDVHLGTPACRAEELLRYLDGIQPEVLIIAGDFVELDVLRRGTLPAAHLAVIRKVMDFAHEGSRVYYLTGNHDARLRRFGDIALGSLHVRSSLQLKLDGQKYFMFHGDILDTAVKYKLRDSKLGSWQHRLASFGESLMSTWRKLTRRPDWSLATESRTNPQQVGQYIHLFERFAARLALKHGCHKVICAHIHQPKHEQIEIDGVEVAYLNAGDWITNLSALEYRFGEWQLRFYDADDYLQKSKRLRTPKEKPQSLFANDERSSQLLLELLQQR